MDNTITPRDIAIFDPQTVPDRALAQELQKVQRSIGAATNAASLQQTSRDIHALVQRVVDQMPAADLLTRIISALNDSLTQRVIEISCADTQLDMVRWCWISLGSEGRQEQTLSSDQDNGIIFNGSGPADGLREMLLPLARRINEALDTCGFPLCRGQIMASNPQWCLGLDEWRNRFTQWIIEGDPQALLNASIFFDLRPLYGTHSLAHELADWLAVEASENSRFLFQMAANALRRQAPLGMLRKFVVEKGGQFAGTIDLKLNGATLFVDAARIYGLACGTRASNTVDRLRLATESHRLHPSDVNAWINAFYFIQSLRLKIQHRNYTSFTEMHNHVDPNQLEEADRHALLDALRQARKLQMRLALDYPGSSQGI
jgi:CBS domain-containing protein